MRLRFKPPLLALLSLYLLALWGVAADAASVKHRNIVDLIELSDIIVAGRVEQVSDGLDANNVPYTEVTLSVKESILGEISNSYTFRQYGLLEPRDMGNGVVNLNTTPDGWPQFVQGEDVVLFLYQAAALTGLRTTVGLFQGKFGVQSNLTCNSINNQGLFSNVAVDPSMLSEGQQKFFGMNEGAVREDEFLSLVRRAVGEGWIQSGVMSNEN